MIIGTDISTYQDSPYTTTVIDFAKMHAAGAGFVYIKATQGNFYDNDFKVNHANSAGILPRGLYHFYDWRYPLAANIDAIVNAWTAYPTELPPMLDYESQISIPDKATAAGLCLSALKEIERRTGKTPLLYTNPNIWALYGSTKIDFAHFPLWIAHYGVAKPTVPAPWTNWTFWQYSSKGDGAAYGVESASIDLDYFNGTLEDFKAWGGLNPPPPPVPPAPTLDERVKALESKVDEHESRIQALESLYHIYLPTVTK